MTQRRFSGDPRTRWTTGSGPDRDMVLTEDFWFVDSRGNRWDAPVNSRINGASIPRFLWSLVGSPYTGDYRRASIVHDVACDAASGDPAARRQADKMFFEACRAGGCSKRDATILYVGVRFGAWLGRSTLVDDEVIRLNEPTGISELRRDFRSLSEDVLRQGESDDPEEVEVQTDRAFEALAARQAALAEMRTFRDDV